MTTIRINARILIACLITDPNSILKRMILRNNLGDISMISNMIIRLIDITETIDMNTVSNIIPPPNTCITCKSH